MINMINCFIIDYTPDAKQTRVTRNRLSLTKKTCHLCQLPLMKRDKKVKCQCQSFVHDDCYKMDGDSCEAVPL